VEDLTKTLQDDPLMADPVEASVEETPAADDPDDDPLGLDAEDVETDTSGKWVKVEEVRRVAEQVLGVSVAYLKECDSDFEGEMLEDFWFNDLTPEAL
jgi:hypothetical protein